MTYIRSDIGKGMKPIAFVGTALDDLRAFPDGLRREAGYLLDRVQRGLDPGDWKPVACVGCSVREIRLRDQAGEFRDDPCRGIGRRRLGVARLSEEDPVDGEG
jgi:Phage derived protein Gp49-like (DUF891)